MVRLGLRQVAADDDDFGVEQVDQPCQLMAQFRAGLADQFDAERIFAFGRFDDVVRRDDGPLPYLAREDRRFAVVDTFDQFAVDGAARNLGFDATLLPQWHRMLLLYMWTWPNSPE